MASFLKEQVCDFLTTGGKNSINPVIYECVRMRARTLPAAAEGERIGPSPPFLFPAGLDRLLVVVDPSCSGVRLDLQSKSSTLGPHARGDELGLTAVAFSLFICFHLHLGFAFRPSEHLLAQAVHEVARARRARRENGSAGGGEIEALRERLFRLSEASLRINESLDLDSVLQGVLDSARTLRDPDGRVVLVSGLTPDEARQLWDPSAVVLSGLECGYDHPAGTPEQVEYAGAASRTGMSCGPSDLETHRPRVAFSLFICFHLHLGFACGPRRFDPANIFSLKQSTRSERAQFLGMVSQGTLTGSAETLDPAEMLLFFRIQRVSALILVLARGRCPESSSNPQQPVQLEMECGPACRPAWPSAGGSWRPMGAGSVPKARVWAWAPGSRSLFRWPMGPWESPGPGQRGHSPLPAERTGPAFSSWMMILKL